MGERKSKEEERQKEKEREKKEEDRREKWVRGRGGRRRKWKVFAPLHHIM